MLLIKLFSSCIHSFSYNKFAVYVTLTLYVIIFISLESINCFKV